MPVEIYLLAALWALFCLKNTHNENSKEGFVGALWVQVKYRRFHWVSRGAVQKLPAPLDSRTLAAYNLHKSWNLQAVLALLTYSCRNEKYHQILRFPPVLTNPLSFAYFETSTGKSHKGKVQNKKKKEEKTCNFGVGGSGKNVKCTEPPPI